MPRSRLLLQREGISILRNPLHHATKKARWVIGLCGSSPGIPDPAKAAVAGLETDTALQPQNYLIGAASTLGNKITIGGQTFDFSGLGQADTAGKISDQMAQTLLALQKEKSPQIIAQRLAELKAADPQGYAARQQLFDKIMSDAQSNPDRPISTDLQSQLQDELAKGTGFNDAKQEQQVQDQIRGGQVKSGIYLGNAPASAEAKGIVNAGESLQSQRQQNALNLLQSGQSPQDIAYRQMQQSLSNLGSFVSGQTPEAQFRQVNAAGNGPVSLTGSASNSNTFNPNAAQVGLNNAMSNYQGQIGFQNSQANPWLTGLSGLAQTAGMAANAGWFNSSPGNGNMPGSFGVPLGAGGQFNSVNLGATGNIGASR